MTGQTAGYMGTSPTLVVTQVINSPCFHEFYTLKIMHTHTCFWFSLPVSSMILLREREPLHFGRFGPEIVESPQNTKFCLMANVKHCT